MTTANDLNNNRSAESWRKIEDSLAGHYARRTKRKSRVSDDIRSDLLAQWLYRCRLNDNACEDSRYAWTVTQVVGDVIGRHEADEKAETERSNAEQTYHCLKTRAELIPTHDGMVTRYDGTRGHSRTDDQREVWKLIVKTAKRLKAQKAQELAEPNV